MASPKTNTAEDEGERGDDFDGPLVDQVIAAVKKMIARGKERGYVTYDDINTALPQGQVSSEQIEDTMSMLSELGINVVENEDSEDAAPSDGKPAEKTTTTTTTEEVGSTDDPVRMYLREMGSVELLSREGEIAIAKRIEAGREKMIGGIRESPLTLGAIVQWRQALVEGSVLLRDVIDLDATFGGPKTTNTAVINPNDPTKTAVGGPAATPTTPATPATPAALEAVPAAAKPSDQTPATTATGERTENSDQPASSDDDEEEEEDDDLDQTISSPDELLQAEAEQVDDKQQATPPVEPPHASLPAVLTQEASQQSEVVLPSQPSQEELLPQLEVRISIPLDDPVEEVLTPLPTQQVQMEQQEEMTPVEPTHQAQQQQSQQQRRRR